MAISETMRAYIRKIFSKDNRRPDPDFRKCQRCRSKFKPAAVGEGLTREDVDRAKGYKTLLFCQEACSFVAPKTPALWGRTDRHLTRQSQRSELFTAALEEINRQWGGESKRQRRTMARNLAKRRWVEQAPNRRGVVQR